MARRKAGLMYTLLMGGVVATVVAPRKMRRLGYLLHGDFAKFHRDVIDLDHQTFHAIKEEIIAIE